MSETSTAAARLRRVEDELGRYILGRREEIRGALLGLVARSHVFYLSPPGAGKSYLASEVSRRVRGSRFFRIDLHAFTMREELFGPVSLSAMRERDALERKTDGYLPAAHVAQLDEIWKCPPTTLNTLLTALNEREFRNGDRTVRIPLLSMIATSNEMPPLDRTLDALWDRILLRYRVRPLTDPGERREATRFSLAMRAFEAEARRFADELSTARASRYRSERAAAGTDPSKVAEAERTYKQGALATPRPDRWVIDVAGELLATGTARAALERDGIAVERKIPVDGELLIKHLAGWLTERSLDLPYETFLDLGDLDALARAALAVEIPEAVEASIYRILDASGGASVRREAELRALIGAQATIEGRSVASLTDLAILTHALWDRPEQEAEVRRAVERETGNADAELAALRATLNEWGGRAAEPLSTVEKIAFRDQMRLELKRFEEKARAFPDRADLSAILDEAKGFVEAYNGAIFASAADAALERPAPPAVAPAPFVPEPLVAAAPAPVVAAAPAPVVAAAPAPLAAEPTLDPGPVDGSTVSEESEQTRTLLDEILNPLDYPEQPTAPSDGAPTLPSGVRWDEPAGR
jgi:MoxR-like ATPase